MPKEEEYSRSLLPKAMADDLFRLTRGKRNLLFAGSRTNVEIAADRLRRICDDERLPQEYFAHHGNLSKAIREDVETRLRDDPRPTTAVATTTLELGIDIGDVDAIAQIGPGSSVASLRQRLGRSGRRAGRPATLRMFVAEPPFEHGSHPIDRLRLDLAQAVAMVECLIEGWCEPPERAGLHLSTLIHQVLALIVQYGGVLPGQAFKLLCERGPFRNVDKDLFAEFLHAIGPNDGKLIEQAGNGLLMIGAAGEEITESHDFYPVFATDLEYRVIHETRTLGTYPLNSPLAAGETIIFSGRRWLIADIDDRARVILVKPTRAGKPPYFSDRGGDVHDHIVATMRRVLSSSDSYPYLDKEAARQLGEARETFNELELGHRQVITFGRGVLLFPWVGTRKLETLVVGLLMREFKASSFHHVIAVDDCTVDGVEETLREIADAPAPHGMGLARHVAKPAVAKFDGFLSPELMGRVTAAERLDAECLPAIAAAMLADRGRRA